MRPYLHVGLTRLERGPGTIQLGLGAGRAVLVEHLSADALALMDRLDGSRTWERLAAGPGGELLPRLAAAGLLADADADAREDLVLGGLERERLAPDLASLALRDGRDGGGARRVAARRRCWVQVVGAGRIGAQVAVLLAASGVGRVEPVDPGPALPTDLAPAGLGADALGHPRGEAVRSLVQALHPTRRQRPGVDASGRCPALVVLAPVGLPVPDLARAAALERSRTPHLLTGVVETTGVVGPLVLPGTTGCLRCRERVRADRDPGWPRLAAQLAAGSRPAQEACEVTLSTAVAAATAQQVLAVLDRVPAPAAAGGTLELEAGDWRWSRRSWPVHPACGCTAAGQLRGQLRGDEDPS